VSYDDGATWKDTSVERTGDVGTAHLEHPPGNGFVSLRLGARDADGNSVKHTMRRAYPVSGDGHGSGGDDPPPEADGCGCRVGAGGSDSSGAPPAVIVLGLAAFYWLRRRRTRAAA